MADEVSKESLPLPPVPAGDDKQKQQPRFGGPWTLTMDAEISFSIGGVSAKNKRPKPKPVLLVCLWALGNALVTGGFSIAELMKNRTPCTQNQSTWLFRCVALPEAAAAEASALVRGQIWCSAAQAAAAALGLVALLLAGAGGRRRRGRARCAWALAMAALVATAANHYMGCREDAIFHDAAPADTHNNAGDVALTVVLALLDLLGGSLLLFSLKGDGDEQSAPAGRLGEA